MLADIQAKYSTGIVESREEGNELHLTVEVGVLVDLGAYLKQAGFEYPADITVVDNGEKLRLVYRLYSFSEKKYIVVNLFLARKGGQAPTVSGVWRAAEWFEREIFDLFGVTFTGHPDLRRILLPNDYDGPPPLLKSASQA
jgi:NADH:ubiquinone oxidoreductase subunit C